MAEVNPVAVVSFDRFIRGDDEDKRAVAKQLYNAFSTVGWVYLKDHGIPQEQVDEIFGLVRQLDCVNGVKASSIDVIRPERFSLNLCKKRFAGGFKMQN